MQRLYQQGARRIAILGLPPIGCVPSQRTIAGGIGRKCDPTRNRAAQLFNSKLKEEIIQLQKELKCQRIGYVDIYDVLQDMITNPCKYGAPNFSHNFACHCARTHMWCDWCLAATCKCASLVAGFDVSAKGCCGTGEFEVSILCNRVTATTCPDDRKYVFWDSFHPTERAYSIMVDYLYPRYVEKLLWGVAAYHLADLLSQLARLPLSLTFSSQLLSLQLILVKYPCVATDIK